MRVVLPEGMPTADSLAVEVQRLIERIDHEAPPHQRRKLLTAAFLLTGLRVRRDVARHVFRGVRKMRDSDTYLAIIDEGKEEHAKAVVLRLGQKKSGPADEATKAKLAAIADVERLDRQIDRMNDAASWEDLLGTP